MRTRICMAMAGLSAVLAIHAPASAAPAVPAYVAAAVADEGRPEADRKRDERRKPAETIALSGVKPGDRVADYVPSSGYFTRIFSKIVGPKGRVYALTPKEWGAGEQDPAKKIAAMPAYANVTAQVDNLANFTTPESLDVVWTARNYHDLVDPATKSDIDRFNRQVYAALKPGGVYLIVDHAAEPGSGVRDAGTLHRIDPEAVKAQVVRAGFRLEAQSPLLRNPGDPHTAVAYDPAMLDQTDQFILKFRKPR